jgi:hypothetical protein
MKRALSLITLVPLGWIYAAPYLAVSRLKQEALEGNVEALRDAVDFPALRATLKEELSGQLSRQTVSELKNDGNGFEALGSALAGGFVGLMVDQLVTPQGIASIVQGKRADGTPDELAGTIERLGGKPQPGANEPEPNISKGYESLDRFCVRILLPRSKSPITLVWLRSGLTEWRLSGIRLPDLDELSKSADGGDNGLTRQGNIPRAGRVQAATAESASIPLFFGFIGGQPASDAVNHAAAIGFVQAGDCKRRKEASEYTDCKFVGGDEESMELSFYGSRLQRIGYDFGIGRYDETLREIAKVHGTPHTLNDPHDPSIEISGEWGSFQEGFNISLGKTADGTSAFATAVFGARQPSKADQ